MRFSFFFTWPSLAFRSHITAFVLVSFCSKITTVGEAVNYIEKTPEGALPHFSSKNPVSTDEAADPLCVTCSSLIFLDRLAPFICFHQPEQFAITRINSYRACAFQVLAGRRSFAKSCCFSRGSATSSSPCSSGTIRKSALLALSLSASRTAAFKPYFETTSRQTPGH